MTAHPNAQDGERRRHVEQVLAHQEDLADLLVGRRLEQLAQSRLTAQQLRALAVLVLDGERTSSDLAGVLGITAATVSGLVDRLVATGMAARRSHAEDGRVRLVSATAAGARAVRVTVLGPDAFEVALLDRLTLDELAQLSTGVGAVLRVMRELGAP
uniref:MarR family winged helix-turn-helix transcriptional regulator n=1 Tax=Actinotalea sp. C106 TaxID=2908644 RepID=UPI0020287557